MGWGRIAPSLWGCGLGFAIKEESWFLLAGMSDKSLVRGVSSPGLTLLCQFPGRPDFGVSEGFLKDSRIGGEPSSGWWWGVVGREGSNS